jgi:hypothetical protein
MANFNQGNAFANLQFNNGKLEFEALGSTDPLIPGAISFVTGGTGEKMIVTSSGNVGINTGSPRTILEVAGNIHVSGTDITIFNKDYNSLALGTSDTQRFIIDKNGRVGVGSSGYSMNYSNFEVYGSGQITSDIKDSGVFSDSIKLTTVNPTDGAGGSLVFSTTYHTSDVGFSAIKGISQPNYSSASNRSTGHIGFYTRLTPTDTFLSEVVRVTSGGRVGIGVIVPSDTLHVNGSVFANQYFVSSTTSTGNTVAINFSTSPRYILSSTYTASDSLSFTGTSYRSSSSVTVRVLNGSNGRPLSFPAGWRFLVDKPTSIAANKIGILTVTSFTTSASDCVAAWGVES